MKCSEASPKAPVVLLFWTYFETRIETLTENWARRGVPTTLAEDTLERYSSIGARLDTLYRVLFGTTDEKDLEGQRVLGTMVASKGCSEEAE